MPQLSKQTRPEFAALDRHRIVELLEGDIAAIQQLYDANPEYSQIVLGRAPRDGDAQHEFHDRPPVEFPMERKFMLGFVDADEELLGVAEIVSDLFAKSVWHIGLFLVATNQHGNGLAHKFYKAIELAMHANGAHWLRLGVVADNARGVRFWQRCGFRQLRVREDYALGDRRHTLLVMVKPLAGGGVPAYLALVERDRPASSG